MSKRTPKNDKNHTTLLLFYVDTRKKLESNKRQWISFRPQRWDVPYRKPSCLLWEAPVCEKLIPKPAPNGKKSHNMLVPLMERMWARRVTMEVKGLAYQWASVAYSSHASRWACALEYSSYASRLVKHMSARHLLAIKRVRRGVTWMVNRTHTI